MNMYVYSTITMLIMQLQRKDLGSQSVFDLFPRQLSDIYMLYKPPLECATVVSEDRDCYRDPAPRSPNATPYVCR